MSLLFHEQRVAPTHPSTRKIGARRDPERRSEFWDERFLWLRRSATPP